MCKTREHDTGRLGLLFCMLVACVCLSCQPIALGSERSDKGEREAIRESQEAIVATYDVVDFGADPASGGQDDYPAIMAAVGAAAAARGGVIYFPAGEYDISQSIVLPRSYTKPITFQGEGRYVSLITTLAGAPPLAEDEPVIDFDPSQELTSRFYTFRDLQISRRNDGYVFRHTQPSPDTRLHAAVFERVIFIAALAPGETRKTDLVLIEGARFCTMSNVTFDGGKTSLVLEGSSHVSIRDSGTLNDHRSANGIRLVGGGSHSIYHTRIEASDFGTALSIEGGQTGIGNIQIDGLFGEGKRTQAFIRLHGTELAPVKNVVMKDINIPTPWGPDNGVSTPSYGIYINDHVRNVRALSGTFGVWGSNLVQNGGQLIHIEDGAKNIEIRMAAADPIEQEGISDYVGVEAGATRVHVELQDGLFQPFVRIEGMIQPWNLAGKTAYVGSSEMVRAAPGGAITTILQAHSGVEDSEPQPGQRVLIFGSNDASVLTSNAGNLRLATLKFHMGQGSMIHLVYDGANWQEVSRSVNY